MLVDTWVALAIGTISLEQIVQARLVVCEPGWAELMDRNEDEGRINNGRKVEKIQLKDL